jgi:ADP-dependent phosphofructokinase/glucokinase
MDIEDKYLQAYQNIEAIHHAQLKNKRYPALGYTSNLDILCDFNIDTFNTLLSQYHPNGNLNEMKTTTEINSIEDFLETVVAYCSMGLGGEVDISEHVFDVKDGIGGTAAQAAMALSSVNISTIIHLTDDSKRVCNLLNSPYVFTIDSSGNKVNISDIKQTRDQEIHYIIQFKKGDKIVLNGIELVIPGSNRIIMTHVTVNEFVPFNDQYFTYIEDNAKNISSNVLSSFNTIQDKGVLLERLNYLKTHINKYKARNVEGIIYFEDAHYHNDKIRRLCLETIYPKVDILSLNEEELLNTLNIDKIEVNIDDVASCIKGMEYLKDTYHILKGVIVHTKDYSMYVGDKLQTDIELGLMYGNLIATAKAMFGLYVS